MDFKSNVTVSVVIRIVLVGMAGLLIQIPTAAQIGENLPQPESRSDSTTISPPTQDKPQVWFPTPGPHEGGIVPDAVARVRITGQSPDTDASIPVGVRQVRHTVMVLDVYKPHPQVAAGSVEELRQSERSDPDDSQKSSAREILPVGTEWILNLWWNSQQAAYWIVNGSIALEVKDGHLVRHSDYPFIRKWDGRGVEEYEQELRGLYPAPAAPPR